MTDADDSITLDKSTSGGLITKGLTKREYFAAMAMQGILSNSTLTDNAKRVAKEKGIILTDDALELINSFCKLSVDCSDALITALNKTV